MDLQMLLMLRQVMREFILANYRTIQLRRPHFSKTEAGGYVRSNWEVVEPQQFRLIPFKRRITDQALEVADGEIPNLPYVLVGFHDCNLKRNDEFFYNGGYYRVLGVEPNTEDRVHTDRVMAQLKYLGKEGVMWDVAP